MVILALAATLILYWRYSTKPWTRDGQVRANVVGIAPRVAGPIIQIPIKDNQAVKKGIFFAIDPTTFRPQLRRRSKLNSRKRLKLRLSKAHRQMDLYKTKTNDLRDVQNAQDNYAATVADTAAAQATLVTATLSLDYTKITPRWMVI
jgi:multidrug resistance efflux pump